METTTKDITLKLEPPEIDGLNFRDEVDQVQSNMSSVLNHLSQ